MLIDVRVDLERELAVDLVAIEDERPRDQIVGRCGRDARDGHENKRKPLHGRTLACAALGFGSLLLAGACRLDLGQVDSAFYDWDGRKVHCAVDIDASAHVSLDSIMTGLDRARDQGEVLELYTHDPGHTVASDTIEAVLAGAQARGLAFVTFADILAGAAPPSGTGGLALSFDDEHIADWYAARPMFQRYGARLTFWIAYYDHASATEKAELHELAADGHAIEAHTVMHQRAPAYVEQFGLDTWLSDEVQPSIDWLRQDGYTIDAFAYPYGARTDETDDAVLGRVSIVRSVVYPWDSPATSPCPY